MQNILVPMPDKASARFLKDLIRKLGYSPIDVNDKETQMIARRKLVELASKSSKSNFNLIEIQKEIDAVRAKNYGKH